MMKDIVIGVQMYTLRDVAAKDFLGTLHQVAQIGYTGVELAGDYGVSAPDLRKALDDLDLAVFASHVPLATLENNLQATIDYHQTIGCRYIVCPYLPPDHRPVDQLGYTLLGKHLTEIGRICARHGLQLCYHNHDFEFVKFGETYALEDLFAAADPQLVQAEPDVYWLSFAGLEPVDFLRGLDRPYPLLHLKDMGRERQFAEVGEGSLDWRGILGFAQKAGVEYFVVEQDVCQRPPLEAVSLSLDNLRRMGWA